MKTPIEKVRELILNYDFSNTNFDEIFNPDNEYKNYYDGLRHFEKRFKTVNNQVLHDSFKYFIDIDETKNIPAVLGHSKQGGRPHLPKEWEFPADWKDYLFLAQLNISEFKHLDVEDIFPEKGIIYFFQHADESECHMYYLPEVTDQLVERNDIESFFKDDSAFEFTAGWAFLLQSNHCYGNEMYPLTPKDLQQNIEQVLNDAKMQEWIPGHGIEVRPEFFQGEREDWKNEQTEISNDIVLYQTEANDVSLHFWIDKQDLKAGNFNEVYQTYSGT